MTQTTSGYAPIRLWQDDADRILLGADGYTITFGEDGAYLVSYGLIPGTGAGEGVLAAILIPDGCNQVPALGVSVRPLLQNNTHVSGSFVAGFEQGSQIYLGVHSNDVVTLPAVLPAVNAFLTIMQIQ